MSNISEHIPHFIGLDVLSNHQKPPQYMIKDKQDDTYLMSFYNETEICLGNIDF